MKFSGLISYVNIDNPAKCFEVTMYKSCISINQDFCAILDLVDP